MANLNPFYIFESEPTSTEIDTKTIELEPIEIIKEVIETPIIVIEDKIIEKNFHLIAGAFSKETNAEKFVLKLQNDNYNSSIVGKTKGGLIRVCFDSFATKEEATTALNILKSDNKSAWILSL
jgi:cell division protein FtsN